MPINNPHTWVRLRRNDLRAFANLVGNEVLKFIDEWPKSGEAREIKAVTERITRRLDAKVSIQSLDRAFSDLLTSVQEFQGIGNNTFFRTRIASTPLHSGSGRRSSFSQTMSVMLREVQTYIDQYVQSQPPPPTADEVAASEIAQIVPEQKLGPASFEVRDGVLRVAHQRAATDTPDRHNTAMARDELVTAADDVLEALITSNVDARLAAVVAELRERLRSQQDIIRLGLAAISFQIVCERFENELPLTLSGSLFGFAAGISMYVAQFPAWLRFSENAAQAEYSPADVKELLQAGHKLAEELRELGPAIDPEVPQTLTFLLGIVDNPRRAGRRTVFAAIRTIENIVSAVIRASGSVLGGAVKGLTKGAEIAATTSLLVAVSQAAVAISPAAGRILQVHWLGKVGELVLKLLQKAAE